MSFDVLHRKFEMLRKDPIAILRGKTERTRFYDQVHTSGLHKGGHPTRSPRLLFTCSYTSNAAKVRTDILDSVSNPLILSEHLAITFATGHPE